MAIPLFVLGKQRSGTTWLANQLCEHSLIVGVRHTHHGGIHESAYFSHVVNRYGDLRCKTNYVEFVEAMSVSDTMRILGISKEFLYSLWPTDYATVFRAVMEHHAEASGARYWLDKTPEHTLLVDMISATYPEAKFIAIIRNIHDVIRSDVGRQVGQGLQRKRLRLIRAALSWVRHYKAIESFSKKSNRIFVTQYEELKDEPEKVYQQICKFLGLEFEPKMLQQAYRANTTFRQGSTRDTILSHSDRRLIDAAKNLGNFLPTTALRALAGDSGVQAPRKALPSWFFSMYPPVFEDQGHQ